LKIVIQRVRSAGVKDDNGLELTIQNGLVLLIGFDSTDTPSTVMKCVQKILKLRIFNDSDDKMNLSISDINGDILVIPNFTLSGSLAKGNRPSFDTALPPREARVLFEETMNRFKDSNVNIVSGFFGEHMLVSLCNDGPATFILSSECNQ